MKRLRHVEGDDAGFSLVELLVVIMLVSVVTAIALNAIVSGLRTTEKGNARVAALASMQKGVERISREIRVADPVVAATSTTLTVRVYRGGARREYTYSYTGTSLTEKLVRYASESATAAVVGQSERVLVSNTASLANPFRYYDDSGVELSAATLNIKDIHRIRIAVSRKARYSQPLSVTTDVFLRNER
jgi:prepilin-type N-terminal cleavage/methylation domain-containing protein